METLSSLIFPNSFCCSTFRSISFSPRRSQFSQNFRQSDFSSKTPSQHWNSNRSLLATKRRCVSVLPLVQGLPRNFGLSLAPGRRRLTARDKTSRFHQHRPTLLIHRCTRGSCRRSCNEHATTKDKIPADDRVARCGDRSELNRSSGYSFPSKKEKKNKKKKKNERSKPNASALTSVFSSSCP